MSTVGVTNQYKQCLITHQDMQAAMSEEKKRIPAFDSLPEFSFLSFPLLAVVVKREPSSSAGHLVQNFPVKGNCEQHL